jgi:hypothetical protein
MFVAMDQGDAELLERIASGERVFRPGGSESARRVFEALVVHLRELRQRGLIDMPERSVAHAADTDTGAYLMAGPCFLTEAGRAALQDFRNPERRQGDRRATERRRQARPDRPEEEERRRGDRRGGDRRA